MVYFKNTLKYNGTEWYVVHLNKTDRTKFAEWACSYLYANDMKFKTIINKYGSGWVRLYAIPEDDFKENINNLKVKYGMVSDHT